MSARTLTTVDLRQGRYLLFLDILGFSELVKQRGRDEVLRVINEALDVFDRWARLNRQFKTIYFSDTFLFYQVPKGYGKWAFLDVYAIGALILTSLLAKGIPARGAISFGDFDVFDREGGEHQVYFGRALIEAHEAEQRENWVGITILPSAWMPFEADDTGIVRAFECEKVWLRRADDVLLLNPFIKLPAWHVHDLIGEINCPYQDWDPPDFPSEILAFRFLRDTAKGFSEAGDFTGKVASKYHVTQAFLSQVFGPELFAWANKISTTALDDAPKENQSQ
jgi:hypothetical protein